MTPDRQFEDLVERYYRDLYRFGFSLVHNEADAADLTQQTFYIWATKGHQLRDPAQVKSWLFTALHREFLQRRRRETRFPHQDIEGLEGELPVVEPNTVEKMDARLLLEFLGRLDARYQAPLVLYYIEDMAYKEIAAILAIPMGTVQSRISRGKYLLYQMLISTDKGQTQEGGHE